MEGFEKHTQCNHTGTACQYVVAIRSYPLFLISLLKKARSLWHEVKNKDKKDAAA